MPKSKEYLSSSDSESADSEPKSKKAKKLKKAKRESPPKQSAPAKSSGAASSGGDTIKGPDGTTMYPLSKQRNVSVSEFRGQIFINIREYYEKDGKLLPGRKGISLSQDQWEKLKASIPDIDRDLSQL